MPILIDYSGVFISKAISYANELKEEPTLDNCRFATMDFLRNYSNMFKKQYGDIVICCDANDYWRKKRFKYYKEKRKSAKKKSKINWTMLDKNMDIVLQELVDHFPYKIIRIDHAEADDVIGVIAVYESLDDINTKPRPVCIISRDTDFLQLQKYSNVVQYEPVSNKFMESIDPDVDLLMKILQGDTGDGIPNVLSDDDGIVREERQTTLTAKRRTLIFDYIKENGWKGLNEFAKTQIENKIWKLPVKDFRRNCVRNRILIDLRCTPPEIQNDIADAYLVPVDGSKKNKNSILTFFMKEGMVGLVDHLGEF